MYKHICKQKRSERVIKNNDNYNVTKSNREKNQREIQFYDTNNHHAINDWIYN